jgi:membrane protease YdiL (CAAX protease family)
VLIGVLWAIFLQTVTTVAFVAITLATGHDLALEDAGEDVFEQAGMVWEWSDERLQAAAENRDLPDPPRIFADLTAIKIGFATTLVYEVSLIAVVAIVARQADFKQLRKNFHLERFSFEDLWVPVVAMIGLYVFVIAYTVLVDLLGIDALEPRSNVPEPIQRDNLGMIIAGVLACLAAPFTEELFFRGLVFRGLLRWGFLPAAAISAFIFSGAHLSIGALIPFFVVGMTMAWLYWRRSRLWDTIVFHFLFNATSFALLAAGAGE